MNSSCIVTTRMVDLPEEVLLMIFKYLSTSDLINNIRKVCARWKRITNDRTLYQYVVIDQKLNLRTVQKLLRKNRKHITSVELKRRTDVNRMLTLLSECTNLLSLKIASCQGQVRNVANLNNTVNVALIRQLLSKCKYLRVFEINESTFKNCMRNFCPENVKLRWLRIKSNNDLEISESRLEELSNLQVLELQGVKLYDDRILQRILVNNAGTLTVLKLNIWSPPSTTIRKLQSREDELMQYIGRCIHLTKLSLEDNSTRGLTDSGFAHLVRLKRIRSLTIVNAKLVSVRAIMRLFYEPHMQQLEELNLGRCPHLHQLVLKHIVDRCPRLRKLCLDQFGVDCQCISIVDLEYIGDRCVCLEHLELYSMGTQIGEALPSIIKRYPNLRSFKYYVHPLKDYLSEYDSVVRSIRLELPKFIIICTTRDGINGYRT